MIMDFSYRIFKVLAAAFALVGLLASCSRVDDVQPRDVGYLEFPAISVDASVDNMLLTKALDFSVAVPEDLSGLAFVIYDSNGAEVERIEGAWTKPLTLRAGDYTVEASIGTDGFGDPYSSHVPYYVGRQTFTVSPLAGVRPAMTLGVGSSLVRITVADDMAAHFMPVGGGSWSSSSEVTLTSAEVEGEYAVPYGKWAYVPSDAALTASLSGVNSVGREVTFTYSMPGAPAAATAYNVVCGKDGADWPAISIEAAAFAKRVFVGTASVTGNVSAENKAELVYEVSELSSFTDLKSLTAVSGVEGVSYVFDGDAVGKTYYVRARIGNIVSPVVEVVDGFSGGAVTATHYKDAAGNLAGTDAILDFDFPSGGILERLYNGGALTVSSYLYKNGISGAVRTVLGEGEMGGDTTGWPYLPQTENGGSSYTLRVVQTLGGANSLSVDAGGVEVPKPTFALSLTSYSSYDKYLEGDPVTANGTDAFTVKNLGASWTVAAKLINNSNYSKSLTYVNNGASSNPSFSGTSYNVGDKGGLSVGTNYPVSATLTFDGVTKSDLKSHYITGLPFRQSPPQQSEWDSYASNSGKVSWSSGKVNIRPNYWIGNAKASITSKKSFILPAQVNVSIINDAKKDGGLGLKYYLKVGSTVLINGSEYGSGKAVAYNQSTLFTAGTYNLAVEVQYGGANETSSFDVTNISALYGPLP